MEYISSDTNVWIDFSIIKELELPFRLNVEYLMNEDAINDELLSPKGLKSELLQLGLVPTELSEEEFYYGMTILNKDSRLSKYDCAALAIAKKRGIALLTGDMRLRKMAESEGVSVIGTIGILERLYTERKISSEEYTISLERLIKENGQEIRLPMDELKKRLEKMKPMDIGKLNIRFDFTEGYGDEPFITFRMNNTDANTLCIWEGLFADLLDSPDLSGKGWKGFTRDFHEYKGIWSEEGEEIEIKLNEYYGDIVQYLDGSFRYEETGEMLSALCRYLTFAKDNGLHVFAKYIEP